MQLTVRASTGAEVLIWHEFDSYHARRADATDEPQICLGVDLFEVIADLAGLDLEQPAAAEEAIRLADEAQRSLAGPSSDGDARERTMERQRS